MPDTIWIDGPALRGRDEREVMRLTAGEVRMAPKITLNERLDRVQRDIARLEARNHGLRRLIAEEKQDMKMMSSFQPASAAQSDGVKPLSTVFEDELEADLAAKGGNRDDPAQRAASARSTLIRWRSRPPSPNAPGADTAPSLADQLDSGEVSRAINAFMPTNAPIPSTSVANTTATTGVPAWARSSDAATAANKIKQAPYEGVTATTYGSRAVMSEPDDAPRYGARSAYGAATTKAMHTLAEKRGLDMSRPADRDRAAALHFAEGGVPLSRAGSFEQGLHAVLRDRLGVRPELVCMAENDDKRAQATRILAKERPDLVDSYRSPQPAAEDVREVLFNERIGDELRQVDPLLKDRFAIAVKRALANHAPLAPTHYGSRGA